MAPATRPLQPKNQQSLSSDHGNVRSGGRGCFAGRGDAIVRVMAYRIRMAAAVEKWLDELQGRDPATWELIEGAIARLRDGGASVGSPLVVKVAPPRGGQPAEISQEDPRET